MNISTHEEYGLRCALQLARSYAAGPVAASKVAESEGLSPEYVSKFMHLFRKAQMVESVRGTQGGFRLRQEPSKVSLKEVLDALRPQALESKEFCEHFKGQRDVCAHAGNCSVRPVWSVITSYFSRILERLSLADLLQSESSVRFQIEASFFEMTSESQRHMKGNRA